MKNIARKERNNKTPYPIQLNHIPSNINKLPFKTFCINLGRFSLTSIFQDILFEYLKLHIVSLKTAHLRNLSQNLIPKFKTETSHENDYSISLSTISIIPFLCKADQQGR